MEGQARRAALVTGAASGIGRAITERLVDDGLDVLAVDITPTDVGTRSIEADLTTTEGNRAAVEAAVEGFGRLDVIVPNAGFQHVAAVEEFPVDRWEQLLALLLTSPFLLARYGWSALRASDQGRFIAVASVHGLVASPFKAGYVSAKHGLLGLIKVLALEGAPEGIAAAAVCPGYVRTPLVEGQIAAQAEAHGIGEDEVLEDVILQPHAIKRLIEPTEVAAAVSMLAGPAGAAFTGNPLVMDMGWSAR